MDFCNAGHNPPILDGQFMEMESNAPIGLWPGLEFVGESIESIKGRPLFVYSDGLNEAENRQQEQFGDDRLLEILQTNHFDNAQQVIDYLCIEVEKHRNGAAPNDDLTMMTLKVD
jgi:serine phosphatase RsbU (regulator of sigma subunit)